MLLSYRIGASKQGARRQSFVLTLGVGRVLVYSSSRTASQLSQIATAGVLVACFRGRLRLASAAAAVAD